MEIVDLSIDDPEIQIKNDKKVRKKFNELKKYIPFLKYISELDPEINSKYKTLIDWLKIKNHSSLDHWHVISCESTVRRKYEKLKNILDFPTHIKEIFEGGISIVISDEDDSDPAPNSTIFKKEEHSTNDNKQNKKNVIAKEPTLTTRCKNIRRLEGNEAQTESRKKCEHSSTREKTKTALSSNSKKKFQTDSLSKITSKSRSSKYCKDASKKENKTDTVDASVFDIVSWKDLEQENEKSPEIEHLSCKEPPGSPLLSEYDKRKKKNSKHNQKKQETNSIEIEDQSYESLIKQKNEIIKLLRDDDMEMRPLNNGDNLEKPKKIELFQRRESTMSERKKSFVSSSIMDSVKCVLKKNPEIIAEVVNDSMGTKIVYDYTNVTRMSPYKTIPAKNIIINMHNPDVYQGREIGEARDTGCAITGNVNDIEISSTTPETNNNCTAGDAYRKAMHEQQSSRQFQESMNEFTQQNLQCTLLNQKMKISNNLFASSKSSNTKNNDVNSFSKQQLIESTQPRISNSKSSSRTHLDCRLKSEQIHKNKNELKRNDCDINIENLKSSEVGGKSIERQTKQTNCIETLETISTSFESKQKQKENNKVVVMSFAGRSKVIHRIESESSLEEFVPEKINLESRVHSSSIEKAMCNDLDIKSKTDETSNQSRSSSNFLKNTVKRSKDCDGKTSKTKTNLVSECELNEIKMPILFKKDEPRTGWEPETTKLKRDAVGKKLESAAVSSKIDHITTKPKNELGKDPMFDLLKKKKSKSESKNIVDKAQKRKTSVDQDHDCCLKQKQLQIINVSKMSDLNIDLEKSVEKQEVKNKNYYNKSSYKKTKTKDNTYPEQNNSKNKESIESTKKANKRSEVNSKISTRPTKDLTLTPQKPTNFPAESSIPKLKSNCLDIESKQKEANNKDKSSHNTIELKNNCHTVQKCFKRTSTESTTEVNNQPVKKSKKSTKPIKVPTPTKVTNPERRFYRELNNLTCTFKESLLPQTIGRRRCSSSWLNLSEHVNQKSKQIDSDLTPVPIQRRRQTSSGMPNLKLTLQRSSDQNDEYYIKDVGNERSSNEAEREFECNTKNSLKTIESPLKEMPRLVPFESIPIQTLPKKLDNIDSKMTFRSTRTCVLCNKNSNDLTNHYVVKHKTESFVSRLSSADIQGLEKEKTVAILVSRNRYRITCVFCKQIIEDDFENFYAHFSYHTGEYNFQCDGCKIRKPYKEDIGSHQLRSRVCRNSKIVKVHHHELETLVIYLHICKICNFVNLNELNLQNHLRKHHGLIFNELENSKKCFLLVRDIKYVNPGFEGNLFERDSTPTEKETPLCAEQDFICELPMNIQNILMVEDNLTNGQEPQKTNEAKTIIKQKSDFDEPITAKSPETLLEEMHAENNEKNTQARNILSESNDLHAQDNINTSVSDFHASEKNLSHNNKKLFKNVKLNREIDVEKQNDFESLTDIEAYIKSTNKIQSPKRPNIIIFEGENSKSVVNKPRKDHKGNLEKITDSKKSNQSIETSFEDLEYLTSIEEYIESTKEIICQNSENQKPVIISPVEISLEKLSPSKSLIGESSQLIEKHFEDLHDPVSLTNIEPCSASTYKIPRPNSESRIQELHDANNSISINKNSIEMNCKSPGRDLERLHASKSSNEESNQSMVKVISEHSLVERTNHTQLPNKILAQSLVEPEIRRRLSTECSHSLIHRQYDKLDLKNFGLFKCLMEDCLYSTNSDGEFKVHCSNHNQKHIFDCPYCSSKSFCLESVINHIWKEHSMSNYQCVKCSYRSIVPGNVIIHRKIFHEDSRTVEWIYGCGHLKISKERQIKAGIKEIRNNIDSLKCPDCLNRFFSVTSIKSHLQNRHPLTFQRFNSLKLNELACIQCTKESNSKQTMQVHLALQHPDEPGFVIEKKLKPKDCGDADEGFMVVDISIDVHETDFKILEESESLNTVNSNKDQEELNTLEAKPKQLEIVTNCKSLPISTVIQLDSPTKSSRFPDSSIFNHQPGQSSETSLTNSPKKSLLMEKKNLSKELWKIGETPQIENDSWGELSGPIVYSTTPCESKQNEQAQTLEDIVKIQNLDMSLNSIQVPSHLQIQPPNESHDPVFIDNDDQAHLENKKLEVHFEITSNFRKAVVKYEERIKLLLDLLVENTGVHKSTLYGCPKCNSSFMHFELWLTHIKMKHTSFEDLHCPHCSKQLQFDLAESHFIGHLRHEYICYYCIASCCSRTKIQEHFSLCHENCKTIELPLASFYLVIKEDVIVSDYKALLEHFAEELYLHLVKKIQHNTINEWTAGLADSCLEEMEIPQYKPEAEGQPLFKCFVKSCPFVAPDENSFDEHLMQHELPTTFECTYCMLRIAFPSWESVKFHRLKHQSPSLYVCCVCKFVHYNNDGLVKHIENLHNSRDVPVLYLLRSGLNFNVSISIFLPVNKISFTTSKVCFCCAQEISSCNSFLNHLKKFHKISLCLRCQLCGKIILTQLDGEAHYKDYHKLKSFKLKYDVLTTYLNNLIVTSRSPLTIEVCFRNKKDSDQEMESNDFSSIEAKEEIFVKGELEEDKQKQSISIKCLHSNQLLENQSEKDDNTFQSHLHQSNGMDTNSTRNLQTIFLNRDVQHFAGGIVIENTLMPSELPNSVPSRQHQQIVNTRKTNLSQGVQPFTTVCHSLPFANTVIQYSSQEQAIVKDVPFLQLQAVPHSTTATAPRCFSPSTSSLRSLLFSQSQNEVTKETAPSNCTLSNCKRDSLPSTHTQHVVLKNIQLATGNAILSIPLEAPTAEQQPGIVEESQRIPVITTKVCQPRAQQKALHPTLFNTDVQINKPNLDEIAPICGTCNFACTDFIQLQTHYEVMHAIYNESFYFYVDRKIGCMYCHFQGVLSSFAQHHATFHPDRKKLCHNVLDPLRCGICNDIFRFPPSSSADSFALSPLCACPGHQRTLADCLNLSVLKSLQDIGYRYYKYSCDACGLSFPFTQHFVHHYISVHNKFIDPQIWRTRLRYYCCICPSVVSYYISDVIDHMRFSHLKTSKLSLFQRFEFYKKIRIAHPNGYLVSLDDLRNTGQFDEEDFKQKIYNSEAQFTI